MDIVIRQNTDSIFGNKNYEVVISEKRIYLIEKSIIPFSSKHIIREAKNKMKIGEFEGNPNNTKYGAIISIRRGELHIDKLGRGIYKSVWQNKTNKSKKIECIGDKWEVSMEDQLLASWSYAKVIKNGKNHILLKIEPDLDTLEMIAYATLFDVNRIKFSISWSSSDTD